MRGFAIRRMLRALSLSLLGAVGAGVSAVLIYVVFIPVARGRIFSVLLSMVAQGLCFLALGYGLGLSVALWINRRHPDVGRLALAISFGGALYGAFSFLSTAGAIIGLGLFAIVLAVSVGIALGSVAGASAVGLAVLVLLLTCFQLWRLGDPTFLFMMGIFDPMRAILIVGLVGMIPMVTVFYFLNLVVLVALWRYGEAGTR